MGMLADEDVLAAGDASVRHDEPSGEHRRHAHVTVGSGVEPALVVHDLEKARRTLGGGRKRSIMATPGQKTTTGPGHAYKGGVSWERSSEESCWLMR
jgi:hypothetical protein